MKPRKNHRLRRAIRQRVAAKGQRIAKLSALIGGRNNA